MSQFRSLKPRTGDRLRVALLHFHCVKCHVLLYYITDRRQFPGDEIAQRARLLAKIEEAVRAGVDYIQLRERDLSACQLEAVARMAVRVVREANALSRTNGVKQRTRLLVNSRIDIALGVGADGVHLRSDDTAASDARAIWSKVANAAPSESADFAIACSCHTTAEVRLAEAHGADLAVFAPVFEKTTAPVRQGIGLDALREACHGIAAPPNVEGISAGRMPVLALGGVTLQNACLCLEAGAAGIAAIRLFQDRPVAGTVEELRAIAPARFAERGL
jgi:thiamine-phosphate pyrophosphorylase